MSDTKKQEREIKSAEQTDLPTEKLEKITNVQKRPAEQTRIGTTTVVKVPYEYQGKEYFFEIKPMNAEQQTDFGADNPKSGKPIEELSPEEVRNILDCQKELLLSNIVSTPDGDPVTLEYINAMEMSLYKKLTDALSGGISEDFID